MEAIKGRTRVISLSTRGMLAVLAIAAVLVSIALVTGYARHTATMDARYQDNAMNAARTAAAFVDGDIIAQYLDKRPVDAAYDAMYENLLTIKAHNEILWLHVEEITPERANFIMDVGTTSRGYPLGAWDVLDTEITSQEAAIFAGQASVPTIYKDAEDGWLLSLYHPVFNSEGLCTAHVRVVLSMEQAMSERYAFLTTMLLGMLGASLLLAGAFFLYMQRSAVRPLNQLVTAAANYIAEKDAGDDRSTIEQLYIHTGDEIENLYNALSQMDRDIDDHVGHVIALTEKKARAQTELDIASRITQAMLPGAGASCDTQESFTIRASLVPSKAVGGDFYDHFLLDEHRLAVVMADVAGDGIDAALFMTLAKTMIKDYALVYDSPAEVFDAVNRRLMESNGAALFATAFMGCLDLRDGSFTYVNAGHNRPMVRHGDGRFGWLQSTPDFVLAGLEETTYGDNQEQMAPGDCLILYTNGVTGALDATQARYGNERLEQTLNRLDARFEGSPDQLIEIVGQDVARFVEGVEPADDAAMLALQFTAYAQAEETVQALPQADTDAQESLPADAASAEPPAKDEGEEPAQAGEPLPATDAAGEQAVAQAPIHLIALESPGAAAEDRDRLSISMEAAQKTMERASLETAAALEKVAAALEAAAEMPPCPPREGKKKKKGKKHKDKKKKQAVA